MTDHWKDQPRQAGMFGTTSESPTCKKPISFKLPEHLVAQLEKMACDRNTSVNLLAKEIVMEKLAEVLAITE